jgi:hypothetical protein
MTAAALLALRGVRMPPATLARVRGLAWWPVLRTGREVRSAVAVMAALNAALAGAGVALLVGADVTWSVPWSTGVAYGTATGTLGFASLAGPLLAPLGRGPVGRIRHGLVLVALGLMLAAAAPHVLWALVPLALVGAAAVHAEAAATAVLQERVPDEARAGLLGVADTAMIGAALMGSLLGPPLAEAVGSGPTFVALVVAVLAVLRSTGRRRPLTRGVDRREISEVVTIQHK